MKSYTDLEQSKRLSDILPHESADMRFCFSHTLGGRITGHYPMIGREPSLGTIPCWSLTALIELLPNKIVVNNENYFLNFTKNNVEYRGIVTWDGQKCISTKAENLLDACYNIYFNIWESILIMTQ